MTHGYSGTPLSKKLGIGGGPRVRRGSFYRASLLLPILLPGVFWLLPAPLADIAGAADPSGIVLGPLLGSLVLGGIPYAAFALLILIWSRGKSGRELRRVSWWSPVLFLPPLLAWIAWQMMFTGQSLGVADCDIGLMYGVLSLLVGYFYVLCVAGLAWAATRLGWLEAIEPA